MVLYDHTEYTRNRAFQTLRASLWDHVANGYLLKQDVEELMGRIGVTDTLEETLEKSEVVIESVFEDAALKRDLFNQMAAILQARAVPPDQITLCSNTMTLPMQAIIEDIQQKEYRGSCIGMRFLHPVWFIDEVELTDCDYTRRNTADQAERLLRQLFFQPFQFDGVNRRKLTLQEISTYQSRQRLRWYTLPRHASLRPRFPSAHLCLHLYMLCIHPQRVCVCPPPDRHTVPSRSHLCRGAGCAKSLRRLPRRAARRRRQCLPICPPAWAHHSRSQRPLSPRRTSSHAPSVRRLATPIAPPVAIPIILRTRRVEGRLSRADAANSLCVLLVPLVAAGLEEPRSALLVPCGHMAMCIDCAEKVLHGSRPICVVCRQPIEKILRATPPP